MKMTILGIKFNRDCCIQRTHLHVGAQNDCRRRLEVGRVNKYCESMGKLRTIVAVTAPLLLASRCEGFGSRLSLPKSAFTPPGSRTSPLVVAGRFELRRREGWGRTTAPPPRTTAVTVCGGSRPLRGLASSSGGENGRLYSSSIWKSQ